MFNALPASEFPSNLIMLIDYDVRTDGQPVYIGYAKTGTGSHQDGWVIQKFTYDGSDNATSKLLAKGIYDNRVSYTYS